MSKKKQVRYSTKIADTICDLVSKGMTVEEAVRTDPPNMPTSTSVYRWSMNKPEFREQLNSAYECFLFVKFEELRAISDENWCKDNLDLFDGDYKMAFEARRAKMDALKFLLGKMAPILSNRFSQKTTMKLEGDGVNLGPQIVIQNYHEPEERVITPVGRTLELKNDKDDKED